MSLGYKALGRMPRSAVIAAATPAACPVSQYCGVSRRNECALGSEAMWRPAPSTPSILRQKALLRDQVESGIHNIFLVPASGTKPRDLEGTWTKNARLILVVRNIEGADLNYVGSNPMLGAKLAAQHLLSVGHTEIGFVGGYTDNFAYSEGYAGIAAELITHGLTLRPEWVKSGGSTRIFGK